MKFEDFKNKIRTPVFSFEDVLKFYSHENPHTIKVQISRWLKKRKIIRLKRGIYLIKKQDLNFYFIANVLYQPSYVSLESALVSLYDSLIAFRLSLHL